MADFIISRFDADIENLNILEQYAVGRVKIYITDDGKYLVQEPPLTRQAEIILKKLMASIRNSFPLEKTARDEIIQVLQNSLEEESRKSDDFDLDPCFWYHFLHLFPNNHTPHLFSTSILLTNSSGVRYPNAEWILSLL